LARRARIGPYRIQRLVDSGGQGSVYLGYDRRLQRQVAIKLYRIPAHQEQRRQLLDEAQTVAAISHPRVVQVYDIVASRQHLAMVTEYVPGCNLEQLLQQQRLQLPSVLGIAVDLAAALAAVRRQQIVHRDLKAANVLVGRDGHVKLTDFGIARPLAGGGELRGSRSSLSPEQLRGEPLTEQSDLFALGVLLYRLFTGVHPFYSNGRLDARRLLQESPPPVDSLAAPGTVVPPGLAELVSKLLAKSPQQRPADAVAVRQELMSIWKTLPVSAHSTLAEEAAPYFREAAAPPEAVQVPEDLQRYGRSRLRPFRLDEPWSWRSLSPRRNPGVVFTLALLLVLPMVLLAWRLLTPPRQVYIPVPRVLNSAGFTLPAGVTPHWLLEEASRSVRLSPLRLQAVSGDQYQERVRLLADGSTVSTLADFDQQLSLELRCGSQFCLLQVRWETGQQSRAQQATLLPGMGKAQWRLLLRGALASVLAP
jgi:serine/threonine protein kinase